MDLVVLGATGATGRLVLDRALADGHRVTAVVRSAEHDPFPDGVRTQRADVTDATSLGPVLSGADAVIGTLGAQRGPLIERSTAAVVQAAALGGPRRFVVLSGYSVLTERLTRPARLMAATAMKAMSEDKAAGERLLRDSDLDWTIVYATRLTNGAATGGPRVLPDDVRIGLAASVSRADVADVLLRAVGDRTLSRREIVVAG